MFAYDNVPMKRRTDQLKVVPPVEPTPEDETLRKAEIRRQMYERMARGNALADVETTAQRHQRGG